MILRGRCEGRGDREEESKGLGALGMAGDSGCQEVGRPPTGPRRLDPEMRNGRGWAGSSPSPLPGLRARGRLCQLLATDLGTEVPV